MKDIVAIINAVHLGQMLSWLLIMASSVVLGGELDWSFSTPETITKTVEVLKEVPVERVVTRTVEVPATQYRWSYPQRPPSTWYTHPGNVRDHLKTGPHSGKYSFTQLDELTVPELESLHSDDHAGKLKQFVKVMVPTIAPPPPTETPPELRLPAVEWRSEFLATHPGDNQAMRAAADNKEPYVWRMSTAAYCSPCKANWNAVLHGIKTVKNKLPMVVRFESVNASQGMSTPQWDLYRGGVHIHTLNGVQKYQDLMDYVELHYRGGFMRGVQVASIDAGTINVTKEQIAMALEYMGPTGSYRPSNLKKSIPTNGIVANIPANCGFDWSTANDGKTTIKLINAASGSWGLVSLSISGAVYDPATSKITITTPFSAMNPVLTVK